MNFNLMKTGLLMGTILCVLAFGSTGPWLDLEDYDAATYTEIKKKIIDIRCLDCHGAVDPKGNKDFSSYDSLMDSGVITKGDPAESAFHVAVADGKMPKKGAKLTKEEIQMIYDWIKKGAPNDEED